MKKIKFVFCVVVTVMLANISAAFAISIDFQPFNQSATVGDAVEVDVVASGLSAAGEIISAYDLVVGYDDSVVSLIDVTFGNMLDGLFSSFETSFALGTGMFEVQELALASDFELDLLQPDSFTLFTLSFDILSVGTSALTFLPHPIFGINNDVKGKNAALIPVTMGAGSVTGLQRPISVSEPGTLALMLFGFIALFNRSRQDLSSIVNPIYCRVMRGR